MDEYSPDSSLIAGSAGVEATTSREPLSKQINMSLTSIDIHRTIAISSYRFYAISWTAGGRVRSRPFFCHRELGWRKIVVTFSANDCLVLAPPLQIYIIVVIVKFAAIIDRDKGSLIQSRQKIKSCFLCLYGSYVPSIYGSSYINPLNLVHECLPGSGCLPKIMPKLWALILTIAMVKYCIYI